MQGKRQTKHAAKAAKIMAHLNVHGSITAVVAAQVLGVSVLSASGTLRWMKDLGVLDWPEGKVSPHVYRLRDDKR